LSISFLLRFLLLAVGVFSGFLNAAETKAERAANQYAAEEIANAPLHGNLPDYELPPVKLLQAKQLTQIEVTTHFINIIWSIGQLALLLWFGVVARMRDRAIAWTHNRWLQGYSFLLLFLGTTTLLDLPLALYSHHLAFTYKLSVQGWGSWFVDRGKSFLLTWLIGGLLVMLLFLIVRRFPQRWWLVFSFALIPLMFFSEFISPYWIEPLFNQYEPLVRSHPNALWCGTPRCRRALRTKCCSSLATSPDIMCWGISCWLF
jgi:STE24 endopeptidase